jgi:hypothetical protein
MKTHLAILRTAALLVPEEQRAEWFAEWRSELWYAWQNPHEKNLIAFCLGAFRDACWLRRYGPMPRSWGILHLDVPVAPAIAQSFPEPPNAPFLKSPAQCISILALLAGIAVSVAFLLQPVRDTLLPTPYLDGGTLLMISPPGVSENADVANGLLAPYPTVPVEQFRTWKQSPMREFAGLAFYLPQMLPTTTSSGKTRRLFVARTNDSLFSMLHVALPSTGLIVSDAAWRKYFHSDPHTVGQVVQVGGNATSVIAILPPGQWRLPGNFDAWLVEDEQSLTRLPPDAKGFALGRLTDKAIKDHAFPDGILNYVSLEGRNKSFLLALLPMLFLGALLVAVTTFFSLGDYPSRRFSMRRWLFLAAKIALVLAAIGFGAIDLASIGHQFFPVALQFALFSWVFALRWALTDQQRRCPVCLTLLTNPVRIGQPSRMLLEWHGTELMCPRGHGLLHIPDRPAIWFTDQRWTDFDTSWSGLFP